VKEIKAWDQLIMIRKSQNQNLQRKRRKARAGKSRTQKKIQSLKLEKNFKD
jgi:hypothetical protein